MSKIKIKKEIIRILEWQYLLLLIFCFVINNFFGAIKPAKAAVSTWTQTTEADFEAGTLTDIDNLSSSGNFKIAVDNQVSNNSFETQTTGDPTHADGWNIYNGGYTRTNEQAKRGSYSAKISAAGTTVGLTRNTSTGVFPASGTLRFTYYAYISAYTSGSIYGRAKIYYTDATSQECYTYASTGTIGSWQRATNTCSTSGSKTVSYVMLHLIGSSLNGTAYLDLAEASMQNETSGTFTSSIKDTTDSNSKIIRSAWTQTTPTNTSAAVAMRSSANADMSDPSEWEALDANPDFNISTPIARYIQYQVAMSTTDTSTSPTFSDSTIKYGSNVGYISGTITHSQTGAAIKDAKVTDGTTIVYSDENGDYILPAEAGTISLKIFQDGFNENTSSQSVVSGSTIIANISLTPTGEWPMFRMDTRRTGYTPLIGRMSSAPGVSWSYDLGINNNVSKNGYIEDVDNDGSKELLLKYDSRLRAIKENGDLLWESNGDNSKEIGSIIGIYDLDNDGVKDIVCSTGSGLFGYMRTSLVILNGDDGSAEWYYNGWDYLWTEGGGAVNNDNFEVGFANTRILDIDGDTYLEIVVRSGFNEHLVAFDFSSGVPSGSVQWTGTFAGNNNYSRTMVAGDIDGDSSIEFIQTDGNDLYVFNGEDGSTQASYEYSAATAIYGGSLIIEDIDGDTTNEIVYLNKTYGVEAYDVSGATITSKYKKSFSALTRPEDALADIDGDEALEITVEDSGTIYIYTASNGTLEQTIASRVVIALKDVDGDGTKELIARNSTSTTVYGYDVAAGSATEKWTISGKLNAYGIYNWDSSFSQDAFYFSSDAYYSCDKNFADLDGDNYQEILVNVSNDLAAYDANTGTPVEKWRFDASALAEDEVSVYATGDIGNDGDIDILTVLKDGTFRILDSTGNLIQTEYQGYHYASPLISDLNNDGTNEVIFKDGLNYLRVLDPSNANPTTPPIIADWSFSGAGNYDSSSTNYITPILVDLDNDGDKEYIHNGTVKDYAGNTLWTTTQTLSSSAIGQFDSDGFWDVVGAESSTNDYYLYKGTDGSTIASYNNTRSVNPMATFDMNKDGIYDVVDKDDSRTAYVDDVYNGAELWNNTRDGMCSLGVPIIADIKASAFPDTGSITPEVIVGGEASLTSWENDGDAIWSIGYESETAKTRYAATADVDLDGYAELAYPTPYGLVYGLDPSDASSTYLNPMWEFDAGQKVTMSDIASADIDNDGKPEYIFGSDDGYLYALNGEDGSLLWKYNFNYQVHHPVIADSDNDGYAEILVASRGYLYALDDVTSPTVTINFPVDSAYYNATTWPDIAGTSTDLVSGVNTTTLTIQEGSGNYWDGDSWEVAPTDLPISGSVTAWNYTILPANFTNTLQYTVVVTSVDYAGNSGNDSHSFTYNTDKPTVTSATASPNPAKAGTVTITVVFSKAMKTTVSPTVDITGLARAYDNITQTSYVNDTWIGSFDLQDDNETTTATISVSGAQDLASNTIIPNPDTSGTFQVDTITPVISSTSPATNAFIKAGFSTNYILSKNVAFGTIAFTSTATQTYALSGSELSSGTHTITETFLNVSGVTLVDGTTYSIAFNATDNAGNPATAITNTNIIYDTTAPATTVSPAGGTYTEAQTVILSATDSDSGVAATYYTTDGSTPTTSSTEYSTPITISETTTLKFFSVDNSGNQEIVKTEEYIINTTPPIPETIPFKEKLNLEDDVINQTYHSDKTNTDIVFYKLPKQKAIHGLYIKLIRNKKKYNPNFRKKSSYPGYIKLLSNIGTVKKAYFFNVNKRINFTISIRYSQKKLNKNDLKEKNLKLFIKDRNNNWRGPYRIYQNKTTNTLKFKIRNYLIRPTKNPIPNPGDKPTKNRSYAPAFYFRTLEKIKFVIAEKNTITPSLNLLAPFSDEQDYFFE